MAADTEYAGWFSHEGKDYLVFGSKQDVERYIANRPWLEEVRIVEMRTNFEASRSLNKRLAPLEPS